MRFDCTQGYISRIVKKLKNLLFEVHQVPRYKAKCEAKKRCRKIYNLYKDLDFVIDDEKYFGLTGFQMSFYSICISILQTRVQRTAT